MDFSLQYKQQTTLPYASIAVDPLIVLRKIPNVKSIVKHGNGYIFTLKPYVAHRALSVTPVCYIELVVHDNYVEWLHAGEHPEICNGIIQGRATRTASNQTLIEGEITVKHPWLNELTWLPMKPLVYRAGRQYVNDFIANFNNPDFNNVLPD